MNLDTFPGRVGLQQRVLPAYRAAFFDALAAACLGGLTIFAGKALPEESVIETSQLALAHITPAVNRNFFPIQSPLYQCWQSGIAAWLENWQPDILVVEANSRYPSSRLAVRWMHARGRPVVGWGLGNPPLSAGGVSGQMLLPWRRMERLSFLRSLDAVVAYSEGGAAEYRALGFSPERVVVAANATAPRPASPPPQRPPFFSAQPVVLYVGRLQARKRIDFLIHACASLPKALQPRLVVVGDGPALSDLKSLAQTVYPSAEFPGARHGAELEPFFEAADLFVLPGTGGLAVQQAMAHALPVIVAEGDGTQNDLVRQPCEGQGGNGWLVPPNDPSALNAALSQALSDPARLRRMGMESYRVVVEDVNVEKMVSVFIGLFHTLREA